MERILGDTYGVSLKIRLRNMRSNASTPMAWVARTVAPNRKGSLSATVQCISAGVNAVLTAAPSIARPARTLRLPGCVVMVVDAVDLRPCQGLVFVVFG